MCPSPPLPRSVLDFYVHESRQRQGVGLRLFEALLRDNPGLAPHQLGFDRPSPKFLSFLAKHWGLEEYLPQANSFVIFDEYFRDPGAAAGGHSPQAQFGRRTGRAPSHRRLQPPPGPAAAAAAAAPSAAAAKFYGLDAQLQDALMPSRPSSQARATQRVDPHARPADALDRMMGADPSPPGLPATPPAGRGGGAGPRQGSLGRRAGGYPHGSDGTGAGAPSRVPAGPPGGPRGRDRAPAPAGRAPGGGGGGYVVVPPWGVWDSPPAGGRGDWSGTRVGGDARRAGAGQWGARGGSRTGGPGGVGRGAAPGGGLSAFG